MPLSISGSKLTSSFHSITSARSSSIFGSGGPGGSSDAEHVVNKSPDVTESPALQPSEAISQPISDEAKAKKKQDHFNSVIDDKLSNIPLRLIDTTSGKLCTAGDLYALFKESPGYKEIEANISSAGEEDMKKAVDAFFKYAMFSHRWGAADDEPTYQHIKDSPSIYDMTAPPEIAKLQHFCKIARENQFRWAWSDTCCIDKTNNVELQESIISMFIWYRLSSVTIVYLSDVTDEESFKHSVWFTRGWTLQELIAPELIWFYKKDWTPYIDTKDNHKSDDRLAKLLSDITSVDPTSLISFKPGLSSTGSVSGSVKTRMSWLASRKTTKIEDIAYCMMGIFGVHMPVMYGEKENAFVRLQKEIMNLTEDLSLFDWVGEPSGLHSYFASHPRCFAKSAAEHRQDSLGLPHIRLYKTSKGLTTGLTATIMKSVKKILLDPPHGHFIANGKMNMPLFVHDVMTLTEEELTDIPTHAGKRLHSYKVKGEGLAETTIITHTELPAFPSDTKWRYRIIRLWEVSLIPDQSLEDEDEDEDKDKTAREQNEESGQSSGWLGRSKSLLSESVDAVTTAVSQNPVVMYLSRLQEPFVGQLLVQKDPEGPWERVGTTERLIAHPSTGSINFRGVKILMVR